MFLKYIMDSQPSKRVKKENELKKKNNSTKDLGIVSYRHMMTAAFEYFQQNEYNRVLSLMPQKHMTSIRASAKPRTECLGDIRLEQIRRYMDSYPGWERSVMQKVFHESFLQAVALHIYRDDADIDMDAIMRMNDWPNLRQQVLCQTPRRFGKTTAVSMFVAAYQMSVPKSEQCIFSTGKRASDKLVENVHNFIKMIPGQEQYTKRKGEILYYYGPKKGDVRKVSSYPSGSKALRGVGGDVIYLEEAAFMDIKMFHEVIVPLLELETTALIAISTPQDSTNFYSLMFEMKDPAGNKLFNQNKIEMVCEDCRKGPHPEKCTHMKHLLPRWKSSGKQDMVAQIYGDNSTDMLRESMGMTTEDSASVFHHSWVDKLKNAPPYNFTNAPSYVWIACDPNGGGSSAMSIVSVTMENNQYVIVGMEMHNVKGHGEIRSLLVTHVKALRKVYGAAQFIFVPESNLGHEASHMSHMLNSEPRCKSLMERGEPGVITTHKRKELYTNFTVEQFANGGIHFANEQSFVCANPFADANLRAKSCKKSFLQQLSFFNKIVIQKGKPEEGNRPKIIYSGKKSGNDDLVMTFIIGMYWSMMFMTGRSTPNFRDFNN